jgi:uncharacterized protein
VNPQPAPTAAEVIAALGLEPLPVEGGWFRQTLDDGHSTAIYYLLTEGECSALHALSGTEVYHWYAGAPLQLLLLDETAGTATEVTLGPDLARGHRPQLVVPAGIWQGSTPAGDWTLVGTTMAPGYTDAGFTLGQRLALQQRFPAVADRIAELTR